MIAFGKISSLLSARSMPNEILPSTKIVAKWRDKTENQIIFIANQSDLLFHWLSFIGSQTWWWFSVHFTINHQLS
jgi:hypothetical protein